MTTPLYILTGYLGAGKTTLLQNLLRHCKDLGQTPAVLMNEFGAVSVDTVLLQGAGVPVVDMLDGCVCCTLKDSLSVSLLEMIDTYAPDVIFLETTGVASPADIVQELALPNVQEKVQLQGVITLVNATRFPLELDGLADMPVNERTMVDQARHSDVLLMTKVDLIDDEHAAKLEQTLHTLRPNAPILRVFKGDADPKHLLSLASGHSEPSTRPDKPKTISRLKTAPSGDNDNNNGKHIPELREKQTSFGSLQTFYYEFEHPVDLDTMFRFLLVPPEEVVRAKGFFVDAEDGEPFEFHFVAPNQFSTGPLDSLTVKPFALFIGEGLEEEALRAAMQACEVKGEQQE